MSESSNIPYACIFVTEPVLQQGPNEKVQPYVSYLISGRDPHGDFNIRRRFREFLLLRNKLVERFTGMYIPPIPSKKTAVSPLSLRATLRKDTSRKDADFCSIFVPKSQPNHIYSTRTSFKPLLGAIPTFNA
jgi:hypothetical protein